MPLPAGTGLSRRSFLARSAGLALAVYGASQLGLRALRGGHRRAAAAAGRSRVLVSVFLEGGADSLSMLAPSGDPLYRKLRPKLALAGAAGRRSPRTTACAGTRRATALATLHGEGKVTRPARRSATTNADQSHFTSRHYWEVGATTTQLRTGWLGRYLDRVGTPDNPLQGLSLDDTPRARARDREDAGRRRSTGPTDYDFWTPQRLGRRRGPHARGDRRARALPAGARRRRSPGRRRVAAPGRRGCARNCCRSRRKDGKPAYTSPVAYPTGETTTFPQRLAGLAAMLAAGLPLRVRRADARPATTTRTPTRPQALASGLEARPPTRLLAFQRDLEARGLADRVLVHVWSEFGRRAQENGSPAPTTARRASAS